MMNMSEQDEKDSRVERITCLSFFRDLSRSHFTYFKTGLREEEGIHRTFSVDEVDKPSIASFSTPSFGIHLPTT
jgi:hypothetical protein